jgi:voltage-gated potassium channel Kch
VLIVGFGPAGQRVAESLLDEHLDRITVVDLNPHSLRLAAQYGLRAHSGDAMQVEVLEHAGLHSASVVVLTPPDPNTMRRLIDLVRSHAPEAALVVRSRYHVFFAEYVFAGADHVVDEEELMGMALAKRVREVLERECPPLGADES